MVAEAIMQFISGLSVEESRVVLESLLIFVAGMVVYSIFIYKFYRVVSSRDILRLIKGDSTLARIAYMLEYVFLFPLLAFFWFLALSILLSILSQVISIGNIFLVSMATIATVRVTAYYDEDLSREIAKLVPLALLAVFLLDITVISPEKPLQVLFMLPDYAETLAYYFASIVFIEFVLKILNHIWRPYNQKSGKGFGLNK